VTTATETGDEVENTTTADSDQLGGPSTNTPTVLPTEESSTVVPTSFLIVYAPPCFSYRDRGVGSWLPAEMKKIIEKEKGKENEKRKIKLLMFQGQSPRSCRRHWLPRKR